MSVWFVETVKQLGVLARANTADVQLNVCREDSSSGNGPSALQLTSVIAATKRDQIPGTIMLSFSKTMKNVHTGVGLPS